MDRTQPEMIKGNENKMNGTESTEVDLYLLSEVFEVQLSKITIQKKKKKQGVSSEYERWVFGKVLSSEAVFHRLGPRVFTEKKSNFGASLLNARFIPYRHFSAHPVHAVLSLANERIVHI